MRRSPDDDRHAWERPGTFEVADGVHRIPLPLPGDGLKAVNVYAIEQGEGLVLVDSGWAIGTARARLESALETLGHDLGSVSRVLVTHVHRDHYELGMHLKRELGSRLELGLGEQASLRELVDQPPAAQQGMMARLAAADASPLVERLARAHRQRAEQGDLPEIDWLLPDHWLTDAQTLELDGRRLEVVATPGHTQGHVVFVDPDAGLLFSGDHVLPHITPSIGFEQVPVESCLADYLASLALVRAMPDLEMLPAHGPVRPKTHDRIDELLTHHEDRLRASADAVRAGHTTGYAVAGALGWTRHERAFADLDVFNQMLAVNETVAHLDVLVRREVVETVEDGGVRHYRV